MSNQLLFINSEDAFTSKSFEVMFAEGRLAESTNNLRVVQSGATSAPITLEVQGNIVADKFRGRSDAKLKTDVRDLSDALDTIKRLTGKSYVFKHDVDATYGFVAQDVQEVLPSLVKEDGDFLSISYFELLPFLVESIKELDSRLNQLASSVTTKKHTSI
jgi:hypothetical protein